MLITILITLLTLSVLILAHELGHYFAAKKTGIKVEEFGIGYPPRIWGKKIGETIYSINWIPFGGFVRLFGQEQIDPKKKAGAFWAKSKKIRFLVIIAGVLANFILAWLLFSLTFLSRGIPVKTEKIIIADVVPGSPAAEAGIKAEQTIITVNGSPAGSLEYFIKLIDENKGKEISLELEDNGELLTVKVMPRVQAEPDQGPLGVIISPYELKKYPFWQMPFYSLIEGAKETYYWVVVIGRELVKMFASLITAGQVPQDIAGPIGIFQVTSQVAESGILALFQFMAILSINLAIVNILPVPALDGGHLLFIIVEFFVGRRPPKKFEGWITAAGIALLIFLMLLVTYNDLRRIFAGS